VKGRGIGGGPGGAIVAAITIDARLSPGELAAH
jgi:hypothetical protein